MAIDRMDEHFSWRLAAVIAIFVLWPSDADAQYPASLALPTSVRSIGMAETGAADDSDPFNSVLNPAVLASQSGVFGYGFYEQVLREFVDSFNFSGVAFAGGWQFDLGSGTTAGIGGEMRYGRFDYGDVAIVDLLGQPIGYLEQHDGHLGLSLAGQIALENGFALAAGGTIKPWSGDYGAGYTGDVTAYDLGTIVSWSHVDGKDRITRVALGLSQLNNGDDISYPPGTLLLPEQVPLPTQRTYSLSVHHEASPRPLLDTKVPVGEFTLNFDAGVPKETDGSWGGANYRVGLEVGAMRVVYARLGVLFPEGSDIKTVYGGLGIGLPTEFVVLRLDFALDPLERIGSDAAANVEDRDQKYGFIAEVPLPVGGR
jgi:hypothetical protein